MLQRHAVYELHDEERLTILFADDVNGADVGMVQRPMRLCFTRVSSSRTRSLITPA